MSAERLKPYFILAEFTDEEREALSELLEERELPNGKSAFREGAESEGLVLLDRGRLKLKSRRTGSVVGTLDAPQHLAAASLFCFGAHEVSALADGPCRILVLPRSGLSRLADEEPRAAFRLAEAVARELAGLMRHGLEALVEGDLV